ncbi:MAG: F0F1 ATP synthase subunit alpha, partial [Anaerolineales bacterium]
AKLADKYVIVAKDFSGDEAEEKDASNNQVYSGPLAKHDAKTEMETMENPEDHRVAKLKGSGGSLTALPIIETLLGDVSAYIPTNVISITDGQIYLEGNLFYAGIRPAINVGLSVSRVGGDAQTKAMKQVASRLRLDMASFRELAAFAQFGSDLDKATQAQLNRGQQLQEILKQSQYEPMSLAHQVIILFAGTNGYADEIPIDQMESWKDGVLRYLDTSHSELGKDIAEKKRVTDETEAALNKAIKTFNSTWQ